MVVERDTDNALVLVSCSRGYARDMVDAVLVAGKEANLKPAGEAAFNHRLEHLTK